MCLNVNGPPNNVKLTNYVKYNTNFLLSTWKTLHRFPFSLLFQVNASSPVGPATEKFPKSRLNLSWHCSNPYTKNWSTHEQRTRFPTWNRSCTLGPVIHYLQRVQKARKLLSTCIRTTTSGAMAEAFTSSTMLMLSILSYMSSSTISSLKLLRLPEKIKGRKSNNNQPNWMFRFVSQC